VWRCPELFVTLPESKQVKNRVHLDLVLLGAGASRRWTDSLASANAWPTTMNRLPAGVRFSSIAAAAPGKPGDYHPLYLAAPKDLLRVCFISSFRDGAGCPPARVLVALHCR